MLLHTVVRVNHHRVQSGRSEHISLQPSPNSGPFRPDLAQSISDALVASLVLLRPAQVRNLPDLHDLKGVARDGAEGAGEGRDVDLFSVGQIV